ncbi:hypothetical protein CAL7102_06128 [Dulcicalothrix desertica PCC 7102]|nr:hypothetical protein CAL7102_06128 [Dulcicalothrix desertica PCC 7102]
MGKLRLRHARNDNLYTQRLYVESLCFNYSKGDAGNII